MYADVGYLLVTHDISDGQLKIGNISSKINDYYIFGNFYTEKSSSPMHWNIFFFQPLAFTHLL